MFRIKRLDRFILAQFLQLFVGAFFICLFVFMMQFTWRYINDLVGKGLTFDILAQFFWHMGITLVPMSLPLAVLLASLITFGNMGEKLELLSMKAAGVSLVRIMLPILLVVLPISGLSFYFQNTTAPSAFRSLRALLISIKISQPAVEIPEGVFYSGVPNVNLFVERKNAETGMLYHTIIYKTDQGFDRAQIVLADSARLEMTADKMHLRLSLWSGEQFQNLKSDNLSMFKGESAPYDRETFGYKVLLIDFDSNFNQLEEGQIGAQPQAKSMQQIVHDVDSMNAMVDSTALAFFKERLYQQSYYTALTRKDSMAVQRAFRRKPQTLDQLLAKQPKERVQKAKQQAISQLEMLASEFDWRTDMVADQEKIIRRHWIEWHTKITLSLACLFFFFVGAPLGAIIRKGGLGFPTVVSVGIFILYYIINVSSMKMAREGSVNMWQGMWLSSIILAPAGAYLTFMANRDSVVFNGEAYTFFLRRLFGLRTRRNLLRKEVILYPPNYDEALQQLQTIRQAAVDYGREKRLWLAPNYFRLFFRARPDVQMELLSQQIEELVETLSNSRSAYVIKHLNNIPQIYAHAHTTPFAHRRYNWLVGCFLPLGLFSWLRAWRFRLRLLRDLREIAKCCDSLERDIHELQS